MLFTVIQRVIAYWNHTTLLKFKKIIFLSLCLSLSVSLLAVRGIWFEPTQILFKRPYSLQLFIRNYDKRDYFNIKILQKPVSYPQLEQGWLHVTVSCSFLLIFTAANQACLKAQDSQCNLYAIQYIGKKKSKQHKQLVQDHSNIDHGHIYRQEIGSMQF